MGNSACCREAEETIVTTCIRDFSHERTLIRLHADLDLLRGALEGDIKVLSRAIEDGANIEARQAFILFGREDTDYGHADPYDPQDFGEPPRPEVRGPTALMLAAKSGSLACVKKLLDHRANVCSVDEDGAQAVHYAAMSGEVSVLNALLQAGAEPTIRDELGRCPLDYLLPEVRDDPVMMRSFEDAAADKKVLDKGSVVSGRACESVDRMQEVSIRERPETIVHGSL